MTEESTTPDEPVELAPEDQEVASHEETCPTQANFYEQIEHFLELQRDARSDGTIRYREAMNLVDAIIGAGQKFCDAVIDSDEQFKQLVSDCEKLYDDYVGPLDIKFIPDEAEQYVDAGLRSLIQPALTLTRMLSLAGNN